MEPKIEEQSAFFFNGNQPGNMRVIYVCMYTHTHIYTYMNERRYRCIGVYICVYIYIYIYMVGGRKLRFGVLRNGAKFSRVSTEISQVTKLTYICVYVYICIYICTCIYVYMYI